MMKRIVTSLVVRYPFFGVLALRLRLEEAKVRTLTTNGKRIQYNPAFMESLTPAQRMTAVAHEIMHCVLGHPWRGLKFTDKKFRAACEHEVNNMLLAEGFDAIPGWVCDRQFASMSNERIYKLLGDDSDEAFGGDCISPSGNSPEDKSDMERWVREAGSSAGRKDLVAKAEDSRYDWREHLRRSVERTRGRDDYSFRRPNPRHIGRGVYLPSLLGERASLDIILDVSGSVVWSNMIPAFLGEIEAIHSASRGDTRVIYWDAELRSEETFPAEVPVEFTQLTGGGGTTFAPAIEYARRTRHVPIIYLTDGEGTFGPPTDMVIWAIPKACSATPTWGEHVRME